MSILANKATWLAVLVVWGVALAVGLVLGFTIKDAEAGKRKPPPPNYDFVLCAEDQDPCSGTSRADLMVGYSGDEGLYGAGGRDIYMGSPGPFDDFIDESTSGDLYGGFLDGEFLLEDIDDRGGLDRVDLSTNVSAYASTDFEFHKTDRDGDGAQDDLHLDESNFGGGDNIYVLNHFGSGRIEYIKFSDKTLSGSNLPLS